MVWISENYSLIFLILVVLFYFLINGKKSVMQWLLYAEFMAERDFSDSGMGRLKLQSVYDSFVATYPIFSKIVPFSVFSAWVDVVLKEMRRIMEENENIKKYVEEFKMDSE